MPDLMPLPKSGVPAPRVLAISASSIASSSSSPPSRASSNGSHAFKSHSPTLAAAPASSFKRPYPFAEVIPPLLTTSRLHVIVVAHVDAALVEVTVT